MVGLDWTVGVLWELGGEGDGVVVGLDTDGLGVGVA